MSCSLRIHHNRLVINSCGIALLSPELYRFAGDNARRCIQYCGPTSHYGSGKTIRGNGRIYGVEVFSCHPPEIIVVVTDFAQSYALADRERLEVFVQTVHAPYALVRSAFADRYYFTLDAGNDLTG